MGAHLGLQVVGRDLRGRGQRALFARPGLFDASVEEVRDMGVLLGLGRPQLRSAGFGKDGAQHVGERLGSEQLR